MGSIQNQPKISTDEEDCLLAMQLASSSVLPMVLETIVELQVLEIISKAGPGAQLSPKEIASQLPTQNPDSPAMLDRMLRLLASYSMLTSSIVTRDNGHVERLYGLASISKYFVSNEDGDSLSPWMFLIQDKVLMQSWCHLKDAVLGGGIPFNMVHGLHAFQYLGTDPRFNQVFNRAMFSHTNIVMKKILGVYKGFEDVEEVVDVGGGIGTTLSIITSKYPTINGINFDLPHVIEQAPSFPGVKHVGGDMFKSIPKGKTIFMKSILHDWTDDYCLKLLRNCYVALPSNGKLIIVETILPVAPETNAAAKCLCQVDILMMTQNPGGKERTEKELETMAIEAGFAGIRKVCCVYDHWIMEFYKSV